jgi:hypothetical protein
MLYQTSNLISNVVNVPINYQRIACMDKMISTQVLNSYVVSNENGLLALFQILKYNRYFDAE